MYSKTKRKRRKEEAHAEIKSGGSGNAPLRAAWKAVLCGGRSYPHGLIAVLRLTENQQELAHAQALPLRVAGASPVGYANKGGLASSVLSNR